MTPFRDSETMQSVSRRKFLLTIMVRRVAALISRPNTINTYL